MAPPTFLQDMQIRSLRRYQNYLFYYTGRSELNLYRQY